MAADAPVVAGVVAAAVVAGALLVRGGTALHLVLAVALALPLALLATRAPRTAIEIVIAGLPFLALGRRLLIADGGWESADPLLLVAPVTCLVLYDGARRKQKVSVRDPLSRMVKALLVVCLIQSLNPLGGSPVAGVVGLLFMAVPLLWFTVGREYLDIATIRRLLPLVVAAACVAAAYGVYQVQRGFPSWDMAWVRTADYASLSVGGVVRAFGPFSSAAEYAAWITAGLVVSLAYALHRKPLALLVTPLLAAALVLASGRAEVILAVAAVIVMLAIRTGRKSTAWAAAVVAVLALIVSAHAISSGLHAQASSTSNPLLAHQYSGLANPLSSKDSTLSLHWSLFIGGLKSGVLHPLGYGTGVTNLAGARFGHGERSTEIDISDAFVAFGLVGGVLYSLLVVRTLASAIRLYFFRRDALSAAVVGILLVTLGGWWNGGYYALAPLLWLLLGWVARETAPETV